jgi:hypothetical protein
MAAMTGRTAAMRSPGQCPVRAGATDDVPTTRVPCFRDNDTALVTSEQLNSEGSRQTLAFAKTAFVVSNTVTTGLAGKGPFGGCCI